MAILRVEMKERLPRSLEEIGGGSCLRLRQGRKLGIWFINDMCVILLNF